MHTRILIIAGEYYPYSTPCAFRMHSFAKYLLDYGFDPIIFSVLPGEDIKNKNNYFTVGAVDREMKDVCPVYRFDIEPKFKLIGLNYIQYICFGRTRICQTYIKEALELNSEKSIDAVLSTHPGKGSSLWAGRQISRKLNIPFIVDFRDLANQYKSRKKKPFKNEIGFKRKLARILVPFEKKIQIQREAYFAETASLCVTVSDGLAEIIRKDSGVEVTTILNGYDEEDYRNTHPVISKKFLIVYAGSLHWDQDPTSFFQALDLLRSNYPELYNFMEIKFYGVTTTQLKKSTPYADKLPIQCHNRVSKKEIVEITTGADLLLHFSHEDSKGIMTSKLTEYLAACRPVLSVPGDGDVVDSFLKDTGCGISLNSAERIAEFLKDKIKLKIVGKNTPLHIDSSVKNRYSRRRQSEKLAIKLKEVINC